MKKHPYAVKYKYRDGDPLPPEGIYDVLLWNGQSWAEPLRGVVIRGGSVFMPFDTTAGGRVSMPVKLSGDAQFFRIDIAAEAERLL